MGSSQSIIGSARRWMLVATFAMSVPAAFAQETPAVSRDDLNATMRIIGDPGADKPDEIVRKIPSAKPKRTSKSTDSIGKDLINPEKDEADESCCDSGTPIGPVPTDDPDTPDGSGTPGGSGTANPEAPIDPTAPTPVDTGQGSAGGGHSPHDGAPDPRERVGGLGQQVSEGAKDRAEDARRHHDSPPAPKPPDDKPPRGPEPKPPASPPPASPPPASPPDPNPPGPRNPGRKPPDTKPPKPEPPAKPPRDRQPPGPRNPGTQPPAPRPPDTRPPGPKPPDAPPRPPRRG